MKRAAKTLRDLGRQVGKSHEAVRKWTRHENWNQSRKPPWDVDKAIAWAKRTLAPDRSAAATATEPEGDPEESGQPRPMSEAKLRLLQARAKKLELERMLLAGELVERAEIERGFVRRVHTVRAAFESLPRQMAAALVGQPENEIERLMDQAIVGILTGISQRPALVEDDE